MGGLEMTVIERDTDQNNLFFSFCVIYILLHINTSSTSWLHKQTQENTWMKHYLKMPKTTMYKVFWTSVLISIFLLPWFLSPVFPWAHCSVDKYFIKGNSHEKGLSNMVYHALAENSQVNKTN